MAQKRDEKTSVERGGFQPLNGGYSPRVERGYVPTAPGSDLPKAPAGRTGEFVHRNGKA